MSVASRERGVWIEASEVIPMFPTFVWKTQLKAQLRDAIEGKILATLSSMRHGVKLSPGEAWQSEKALHEGEELGEFVGCVQDAARSVLRFLRIGYDELEVTGCWATVLAQGSTHRMHSHPNNFLSGAYYVRTHPGADSINFHDPRAQSAIIRPPVVELTAENTDQVVVRVKNGTLLLFPSYLEHSVDANASKEERISLSFNLMFSSFAENLSRPLW
jgi:uncharacterized protein (TIGR02466 family)